MKPAFELPDDWFVENDGQRLVLDPEKVKAAFEARVALQGWQPIESAPRDWSDILLFVPDLESGFRRVCEGYFDDDKKMWRSPAFKIVEPTHWQPLPPPPAASDREERK